MGIIVVGSTKLGIAVVLAGKSLMKESSEVEDYDVSLWMQ